MTELEAPENLSPAVNGLVDALLALAASSCRETEFCYAATHGISRLAPELAVMLRVSDVRSGSAVRAYTTGAQARPDIEQEPWWLPEPQLANLPVALAASARLRMRQGWVSPFVGVAQGRCCLLMAGGDVWGCLDLGGPREGVALDAMLTALAPVLRVIAVTLRGMLAEANSSTLRGFAAQILEEASALIVCLDAVGRVVVCNRALVDLVEVTRDEVLGMDVRDLVPRSARETLSAAMAAGERRSDLVLWLVTKRGVRMRTLWTMAIVGRGSTAAFVCVGQDQTRLDALQAQVLLAERRATAGEIAAGVVHELNNPLTSITVYADYLAKKFEAGGGEGADVEKLRRIGASAQRILRFSRELVEYARPASPEKQAVDLALVVTQAITLCEHVFDGSKLELQTEIAPVGLAYAVPSQIEQIIVNLITNGAQAMGAGPGVVRVVLTPDAETSGVRIEVHDSGPGVPEPDRERIFEAFYTTKAGGKGSGLGLAIVRNIVDAHGGRIWVQQSALGGALFTVALPPMRPSGGLVGRAFTVR